MDEIRKVLTTYRENNPKNVLSHRYFLSYSILQISRDQQHSFTFLYLPFFIFRMLGMLLLEHFSDDSTSSDFELMVECFKEEFQLDPTSYVALQVLVNIYVNHGSGMIFSIHSHPSGS